MKDEDSKKIVSFVRKEPRTVQEIARHIGRSWVTTDSYVKMIHEKTGLIDVKIFRKGTQGALKLVFFSRAESAARDEIEESLFHQIRSTRWRQDFDFMDIYKFVPEKNKRAVSEEFKEDELSRKLGMSGLFERAKNSILCFSGNLSFINRSDGKKQVIDLIEATIKRKVQLKMICRIDLASLSNIKKIKHLMKKYPGYIEIKHCYQPLRGFMIDSDMAIFVDEKKAAVYRGGELEKNTRIVYEITDQQWVGWLEKVFWNLFRSTVDYSVVEKELDKIF